LGRISLAIKEKKNVGNAPKEEGQKVGEARGRAVEI